MSYNALIRTGKIILTMKKLFYLFLAATTCIAAVASCSRKVSPEAERTYELLQGTWESVHTEGHDYSTDLQTGETVYREDFNEDITGPSHPRYVKMRLDRNNMVTILELGETDGMTLPVSFGYTFNGEQLGGMVFSGDYAGYMTIVSIDESVMTLELDDKGQDEYSSEDYYELTTFRKTDE